MFNTEHLSSACVFTYIKKITTRKWSILWCMNIFSLNPPWQEASVHPDGPEFWEKPEPFLYFTAPKGSWEQNVGDRPQQVVHTCRGEGRAEHHDDSWRKKKRKNVQHFRKGQSFELNQHADMLAMIMLMCIIYLCLCFAGLRGAGAYPSWNWTVCKPIVVDILCFNLGRSRGPSALTTKR